MATRTYKSDSDSTAGVVVSKNSVRMNGNKDNYVMADERGVTISGPMSFVSGTEQLRFGGLWTMNQQLLLSLPSTLATPVPTMMINPPVRQFKNLMEDAVVMIGLVSSFAAL